MKTPKQKFYTILMILGVLLFFKVMFSVAPSGPMTYERPTVQQQRNAEIEHQLRGRFER